ncbi:unnamed protein product, partial [Meganyctiphanes norvegica]
EQKCAIMSRLYFCLTKETLRMLWQHFKYHSFEETKLDDGIMALQVMREYYLRGFYQKHSVAEGIKEVRPRWCGKCVNRSHDTQRCGEYSLYRTGGRTGELGWDREDWYYNAPGAAPNGQEINPTATVRAEEVSRGVLFGARVTAEAVAAVGSAELPSYIHEVTELVTSQEAKKSVSGREIGASTITEGMAVKKMDENSSEVQTKGFGGSSVTQSTRLPVRAPEVGDERIGEAASDSCSKAIQKVCQEKLEVEFSDENILQVGKMPYKVGEKAAFDQQGDRMVVVAAAAASSARAAAVTASQRKGAELELQVNANKCEPSHIVVSTEVKAKETMCENSSKRDEWSFHCSSVKKAEAAAAVVAAPSFWNVGATGTTIGAAKTILYCEEGPASLNGIKQCVSAEISARNVISSGLWEAEFGSSDGCLELEASPSRKASAILRTASETTSHQLVLLEVQQTVPVVPNDKACISFSPKNENMDVCSWARVKLKYCEHSRSRKARMFWRQ